MDNLTITKECDSANNLIYKENISSVNKLSYLEKRTLSEFFEQASKGYFKHSKVARRNSKRTKKTLNNQLEVIQSIR